MSPTRTAPDLISSLKTGWNDAVQQWWDQSQAALDPWKQAWDTMAPGASEQTPGMPSAHQHAHEHGHAREHEHGRGDDHAHEHAHGHAHTRCDCESHCGCGIPDADIVLHARAGEERVIPFLLRNPWRREREVAVAVGAWHVCEGGRLEVRSEVDAGESLTLQPCENRVVRLGVRVQGICDDTTNTKGDTKGDPKGDPKSVPTDEQRFGCDVDFCASAYADVRFEGCARPQRVAVVVHPASCNAVELPCDCGCCC
jgi:hypothetical protein